MSADRGAEWRLRRAIHEHVQLRLRVGNLAQDVGLDIVEQLRAPSVLAMSTSASRATPVFVACPAHFHELIEQLVVAPVHFQLRVARSRGGSRRIRAREMTSSSMRRKSSNASPASAVAARARLRFLPVSGNSCSSATV